MDFPRVLGMGKTASSQEDERNRLHLYINLKLATSGQPTCISSDSAAFMDTAEDLLKSFREKNRLLSTHRCPADRSIQRRLARQRKSSVASGLADG